MHTHPHLREQALVYRALGNERRLFLLQLLTKRPKTGRELAKLLGIHPGAVSKHLFLLLRSGIITSRRRGQSVDFWLHPAFRLREAIQQKHLCEQKVNPPIPSPT